MVESSSDEDKSSPVSDAPSTFDDASTATEASTDKEQVSEIISDGSASAFEGTEFRDQDDRDHELLKRIRQQSEPSGRSDY